jgi:hypothetical protein
LIKQKLQRILRIFLFIPILFFSIDVFSINAEIADSSKCNFVAAEHLDEISKLKSLQKIIITVEDYRKWATNSLKALVDKNPSIDPKYKKKFKAKITSVYKFGECIHDAKIRLHGDWKDHIQLQNSNTLISSLDIRLENGSIANFVKFKLFLEGTRKNKEEIILTSILRKVNLIAPKTQEIKVVINGNTTNMLIQEKAAKELLEGSKRRESFIFEGDEKLLFNFKNFAPFELEHLALAKINNPKLMANGINSFNIGLKQFFELQKAYILHANSKSSGYLLDWNILANQSDELIRRWAHYEILLFATNSFHALRPHNRKFYYHPFYKGLEPIYFDGNTISLEGTYMRLKQNFKDYPYIKTIHFDSLIDLISSIKTEEFIDQYYSKDFITKKEMQKLVDDLLKKILIIKNNYLNFMRSETSVSMVKQFDESDVKLFEFNAINQLPDSYFLDFNQMKVGADKMQIQVCKTPNQNCTNDEVSIDVIGRALEEKTIDKFDNELDIFLLPSNRSSVLRGKSLLLDNKKIKILASNDTQISFDNSKRIIKFILSSNNSWALINDSFIENIQISVNTTKDQNSNSDIPKERINANGLTACLNIFNSNISKSRIYSNTGLLRCEDSVNIISSKGYIDEIKIENSFADALDIDFSEIEIMNLEIQNAGNDCVDFSSGDYQINFAILNKCGDKGLSIGEKSIFSGSTIRILSSQIGVSSKDSSKSSIEKLFIDMTPLCSEVFQKKQEFTGSLLEIKSIKCNSNAYNVDKNSVLKIL